MQTPAVTTTETGKPRPYRIMLAVLFSAMLLLSELTGVGLSFAAPEDDAAEPSSTATLEEPRQESSTSPTTTPTQPPQQAQSATPENTAEPENEATTEEPASPSPDITPTAEATPDVTDATITVRVADGLGGVKLRLHSGSASKSGAAVPEAWARCVSNSAGVCTFTVPDTHAAGDEYEAGDNYDQRFWVVQESAPAGWFANQTLGLTGNSTAPYQFRTGPQLRAGQNYSSSSDFMTAGTHPASAGVWQNSRKNPGVDLACRPGVDIAVVLNRTGSAGKKAADAMQDAMAGTNSSLTVYEGASSLAQGLGQAAGHDLVVMVTAGSGSSAGFTPTEQAIKSANALKAQGSRVLAVGVGASNHANLRAISGPQSSGAATYSSSADYHAIGGGQLAGLLDSIAQQVACETTVEVTQELQAYGQDSAKSAGSGWKFELATQAGTVRPANTQTTASNGKVSYDLSLDTTQQGARNVSLKGLISDEKTADGWTLKQITCTINGTAVAVEGTTAKLSIAPGDQVACTFLNIQTLKPAMTVHKQAWDTPKAAELSGAQQLQPGHTLSSGHHVTWTYWVKNTGETVLHNINVVDDQLAEDAVTCPSTTLRVGKSMTCTASGKVTSTP